MPSRPAIRKPTRRSAPCRILWASKNLARHRRTEIDLYRDKPTDLSSLRATLQQLDEPLTLSKRVPILENFGFDVISERTFQLTPKMDGEARLVYLHDSDLRLTDGGGEELLARRADLEDGFLAVWSDAAPNDRFNGLILAAGLDWRQAAVLRAYASYYRQTGAPYSNTYVSQVLNKYADVAADLFVLFDAMFNPANGLTVDERDAERPRSPRASRRISIRSRCSTTTGSCETSSLLSTPLCAPISTSAARISGAPETIAFKLRSRDIDLLPAPKPFAEIFVHSPRFEGIHLRAGPIARGGLRWSDRQQDFRTEILGLAKAQQVKNVVIVPQGAKGGFVPKRLDNGEPRSDPGRGHRLLQVVRLEPAFDHGQSRQRRDRAARPIRSAAMATTPILSSPPTKARPRSRTSRTRFRWAAASGSATRSRAAAPPDTTTRRWALRRGARGRP